MAVEQPLGQCDGIGLRIPAGGKMQFVQLVQNHGHAAVGIVDALDGFLPDLHGVLDQRDHLRGVVVIEQTAQPLDHALDAGGIGGCLAPGDEIVNHHGLPDDGAHFAGVVGRRFGRHLELEDVVKFVVGHGLLHDGLDQRAMGLLVQPGPDVVGVDSLLALLRHLLRPCCRARSVRRARVMRSRSPPSFRNACSRWRIC